MSSRSGWCRIGISWVLALMLLPAPLHAEPEQAVLTARPGLCILKDPETRECRMGVALSWTAPQGDYCLFQSASSDALACWTRETSGEHRTELVSEEDVAYWLQRGESPEHLAEISVRVLSLAQRRPQNRRRRHAWTPL